MNKRNLKRKTRVLLLSLLAGAGISGVQAQLPSFTHTYGAADGSVRVDRNNSHMILTPYYGSDNYKPGYLMASNVESNGMLAVKVTAIHPVAGAQEWSRVYEGYGGNGYGNTRCFAMTFDSRDNSYVLTGYRNNIDTRRDELWLMKIDAEGNVIDDFSYSADSIACSSDGQIGLPCRIFQEPSFYGMDILQVSQDPDSLRNGDFVITGFLSEKPAVEDYSVLKRNFVWRFRFSRRSPIGTPGVLTRYLKVFHAGSGRSNQPTAQDYTYDIQEIPKYGLMLLGHVPYSGLSPQPALPRLPYYALLNYDGGGSSNLSSDVFRYAAYTDANNLKNVRTLLGKDDVVYMLGYSYKTHSFCVTPIKPASGGAGQTFFYYAPNVADLPAFSMYQSRNNSDELVIMGYRLGINEPVRSDYVHPYNIMVSKSGRILSKFNLETIRSQQYVSYAPANPGGSDFFRPFEQVFPLAATPEIGLLNNHINNNDAVVAGVLYRSFTSSERYHATVSQFRQITDDAECHPYHLLPDVDSSQLRYGPVTFNINSAQFHATRYLTVADDPSFDYTCAQIPQQRPASSSTGSLPTADASFTLYPSPAHDQVTIRYSGDPRPMQVALLDVTGRLLEAREQVLLGNTPYSFSLNGVTAGLYIISITDAEGHAQRFRIIKE